MDEDDILQGVDAGGSRIINEDENEFLRRIEEGDGKIGKIKEGIEKSGRLVDDLSLMEITFLKDKENGSSRKEIVNNAIHKKIQELMQQEKFSEATSIYLDLLRRNEFDPSKIRELYLGLIKEKNL